MSSSHQMGTAVMVHGAWADGYCWSNVILPLKSKGFAVTCAPIPLSSFEDDASALQRVIERTSGPVILLGHAYAGSVIAAVHDDRVKLEPSFWSPHWPRISASLVSIWPLTAVTMV